MSNLSYLVLFFPIVLVILLVLEACRSDDPRKIAKRAFANFGVLTRGKVDIGKNPLRINGRYRLRISNHLRTNPKQFVGFFQPCTVE